MELKRDEQQELEQIAALNLDEADERWRHVSPLMRKDSLLLESAKATTPFPGVPSVELGRPIVKDYFVLMADMRDSTEHLQEEPPPEAAVESGLHRLYLETAGLLPTLAHLVRSRGGRVTEYLGDGVLAFVKVEDLATASEYDNAVRLGDACLEVCNDIVAPLLQERYDLPRIEIGVGVACGQAIVTVIGRGDDQRAIAFGVPVFDASNLSKDRNEVLVSRNMRKAWPKGKGGLRRFKEHSTPKGIVGYRTWRETD